MSQKSPTGFITGLVAEIAIVAAVVTLLPKIPLGKAAGPRWAEAADHRPTLAPQPEPQLDPLLEPLPLPENNWRTAVSRPQTQLELPPLVLPPPDALYVEKRLDQAGQQLLSGVAGYISRQAEELLQSPQDQQEDVQPVFGRQSPPPLHPSGSLHSRDNRIRY